MMREKESFRWQQFYLDDTRIGNILASACTEQAAKILSKNDRQLILDIGCVAGRYPLRLASGGARVIGLDAARSGLLLAQKRAVERPFRPFWVESNARILPFADGQFGAVYCLGLLHELVGETPVADVYMKFIKY